MSIPVPVHPGGAVSASGMIGAAQTGDVVTTTFNPNGTVVVTTNGVPVTYGDDASAGEGGVSDMTSPQSTAKLSFSTEASFTSAGIEKKGGVALLSNQKDKDLKTLIERTLPHITEKKGIASYTVIDNDSGARAYKTFNFFAEGIKFSLSQSESTLKLNRGFRKYSPDENPVVIVMNGRVLTGDDWEEAPDPSVITNTDWFSKFLTDYKNRLSSSAGFRNNTSLFFSFQDVFLQVFFDDLNLAYEAGTPLVSAFSATMVVQEGRVIYRPDLKGSGPFPHLSTAPAGSPQETAEQDLTNDEVDPENPNPTPGGVSGNAVLFASINPDGSPAAGPTQITSRLSLPQSLQAFSPAVPMIGKRLGVDAYNSEFNAQLQFLLAGGTRSRN